MPTAYWSPAPDGFNSRSARPNTLMSTFVTFDCLLHHEASRDLSGSLFKSSAYNVKSGSVGSSSSVRASPSDVSSAGPQKEAISHAQNSFPVSFASPDLCFSFASLMCSTAVLPHCNQQSHVNAACTMTFHRQTLKSTLVTHRLTSWCTNARQSYYDQS
eukprot:5949565-Amphidinium_carterae.3